MFCLNNAPLDRETLGHVSWSFLHTTAAYLPSGTLEKEIKDSFVNIMLAIPQIYACSLCRGHFQATPPTPPSPLSTFTPPHLQYAHTSTPNALLFAGGWSRRLTVLSHLQLIILFHLQELIANDPLVLKELHGITTNVDAVLWLWKVRHVANDAHNAYLQHLHLRTLHYKCCNDYFLRCVLEENLTSLD